MRITKGFFILLIYGCSRAGTQSVADSISIVPVPEAIEDSIVDPPPIIKSHDYLFDPLLCEGFRYAVGDGTRKDSYIGTNGKTYKGWYVATKTGENYSLGIHTGDDVNGNGGGNTDFGQPVYSIAKGIVLDAQDYGFPWGNVVKMEHRFLENTKVKTVYSLYAHLDTIQINLGDTLQLGTQLGTIGTGQGAYPAHLHLEIRTEAMKDYATTYWPSSNDKDVDWVKEHYHSPTLFIAEHKECPSPKTMDCLVVACKEEMEIHVVKKGEIISTYPISVGQSPKGHKQEQGDNKTPEGAYRLIQKSRGPFSGDMASFFGEAWIRISYPNTFDATAGLEDARINQRVHENLL